MRPAPLLAALPIASLALGCAVPRTPAELPARTEGWVAVLSGEMPGPISQVARHAWIVANVPGEGRYRRYEMGRSGTDPFSYFGEGDVALHAVVPYEREELLRVVACLEREERVYDEEHPDYFPIPGPNSNTIVDAMLRRCGIHVELPATAIGRDYRGPLGASVTSRGTGIQLESWAVGVKLGLEEGIELHVFALALGVHFWPPAITVPVNPGRIGIDDAAHRDAEPRHQHRRDDDDDDARERRYGIASMQLWSRYARVRDAGAAGGLSDAAMVGFAARGGYGDTLAYGFGVDIEGGVGAPLGFAYAFRLYPVGVAYHLGANTFVGAYAGVGVDGVTARVPGAFELPAELRVEIDVARAARIGARAGVAWFPASDARAGRSLVAPFDELVLGTFARLGRPPTCGCPGRFGRGYFFGLERRELMKSYWLGATFGVEIDFGG